MNLSETWKPIRGFEGHYEVSDRGRVRSIPRVIPWGNSFREVKGRLLGHGGYGYRDDKDYCYVEMAVDGRPYRRKVHRLVCDAFVSPLEPGQVVLHLNDLPWDNRAENLRAGSQMENIRDCMRKKRFRAGAANVARTHCPRGHILEGDNLCVSDMRRGKRACLSCHRAHGRVNDAKRRKGIDLSASFKEIADSYYQKMEVSGRVVDP